jgi:hypothetical protein
MSHRKSAAKAKPHRQPQASPSKVFASDIQDLKYLFLIERLKASRGEADYTSLSKRATNLINAIRTRHDQLYRTDSASPKPKRLKLSKSELIADPLFYL